MSARYLLDTNHLSPLVTLGHRLIKKVEQAGINGAEMAITVPVLAEFLFGIGMAPRFEQNYTQWLNIRSGFIFYNLDRQLTEQAAQLQVVLRKVGRQLFLADALIAVVALKYDLVLLTTDQDFQAVPYLVTENWLLSV